MPAEPRRSAFWPALGLGVVLALCKAAHWWPPPELTRRGFTDLLKDCAISAHADLLFAAAVGAAGAAALRLAAGRPRIARAAWLGYLAFCVVCVGYAVASVQIFAFLRSPLTYPLLYLAGDMRNMRSSIGSFLTLGSVAALVGVPVLYLAAVWWLERRPRPVPLRRRRATHGVLAMAFVGYVALADRAAAGRWGDRDDHLIVRNPHWVLAESLATEMLGGHAHPFQEPFPPEDLLEFAPPPPRRGSNVAAPAGRPRNVLLVVLETTGTRYLSLYGSHYPTTPRLQAEAGQALVFDAYYAHVGQSANSLVTMALSIYPYMTWREYTVEYPDMPGATLADVLHPRGYRTAFLHSGDMDYAGAGRFLRGRGFDRLLGLRELDPAATLLSSWGTDDRVLVDGVLRFIDAEPGRPFFVLAWTVQSHHPYEPSPDFPSIDFFAGAPLPPDDYDLGRYLNTLHQVDRQLGRLFDGLRERGLAEDTLVVVTGDHGEAFGDPHRTWGHGARIYEELVRVPLFVWSPRLFPEGRRVSTIGGHLDLAPTVTDLLDVPAAPSWHGRSLFEPERPPRTYFYAANDDYLLGVREREWKYVYNASAGREELYQLVADPDERADRARSEPSRCRRLRQRLAAWRAYVARHVEGVRAAATTHAPAP